MTRKDYVLIADTINGAINYEQNFNNNQEKVNGFKYLALALASTLESDNPRFDRHRFLVACGVYDSTMADVLATAGKEAK
jgi:hypothetical protein